MLHRRVAYRWRAFPHGRHLGAYCRACGRWLRWVEQTSAEALAAVVEPEPVHPTLFPRRP